MNKRLPLLLSLLALILLAASIAYWVLQLVKPEQRPLAAAPVASQPEPSPDAAATLFGGQPTQVISNFQLTGVVSAGRDSAVILVADGEPPKAVRIGRDIVPGVTVAEVHPRYIMLSDNGVMKRVDLMADNRPPAVSAPPQMAPGPMAVAPVPGVEPPMAPGVVSAPPTMQYTPPQGGRPQGAPTTPENAQVPAEPQDPPPEQGDPTQGPGQQGNGVQMPPNAAPMNQTQQQPQQPQPITQ